MLDLGKCARAPISDEFAGAQLGDPRRTRRLQRIAEGASRAPDVGFPRMVDDDSELEGLYRFFRCDKILPEDILSPHIAATFRRMRQVEGPVLIVHDTTDLNFGGLHAREGLGLTHGNNQGFLLHLALAVMPGEERLPLGACGMLRLCRTVSKNTRGKSTYEISKDPSRESLRWQQLVERVDAQSDGTDCVHVMDRESDNFDVLALLRRRNARFVIRGCHDRALARGGRLFARLRKLKPEACRDIEISERLDDGKCTVERRHLPRRARCARLAVAACEVTIKRPRYAHSEERELTVNVVHVWEPSPPKGEPPVSWSLYTTEPIATKQQLLTIVDFYRSRWSSKSFSRR